MSNQSCDYYKALADKSKKKRDRLKLAVDRAGTLICDARSEKKQLVSKAKPSMWKGSTEVHFSSLADYSNRTASRYIDQMDSVRDGYNREQAAADKSFWFFNNKYRQIKAEVENTFN